MGSALASSVLTGPSHGGYNPQAVRTERQQDGPGKAGRFRRSYTTSRTVVAGSEADVARGVGQELRTVSCSPEETRELGGRLARLLQAGDVLRLTGDLGAGKTTFVQGLAEGLETDQPATSPSFTLLHDHLGLLPLYHLDLYRLRPADLGEVGVEEVMRGEAVVAVEWAERLPPALSGHGLDIAIEFDLANDQVRHFRFSPRGPRGERLLQEFREAGHARAGD